MEAGPHLPSSHLSEKESGQKRIFPQGRKAGVQGSLVTTLVVLGPHCPLPDPRLRCGPQPFPLEAIFLRPSHPSGLSGHLLGVSHSQGPRGRASCECGTFSRTVWSRSSWVQQPLSDTAVSRVTVPCCMAAVATLMASSRVCCSSNCEEGAQEGQRETPAKARVITCAF